jgi:hypothetical protein
MASRQDVQKQSSAHIEISIEQNAGCSFTLDRFQSSLTFRHNTMRVTELTIDNRNYRVNYSSIA